MSNYGSTGKIYYIQNVQGGGNMANKAVYPIPNDEVAAYKLGVRIKVKYQSNLNTKIPSPTTHVIPERYNVLSNMSPLAGVKHLYKLIKNIKFYAGNCVVTNVTGTDIFEFLAANTYVVLRPNEVLPKLYVTEQYINLELPWFNYCQNRLIDLSEYPDEYFKIVIQTDTSITGYNAGVQDLFPYKTLDTEIVLCTRDLEEIKLDSTLHFCDSWLSLNSALFDFKENEKYGSMAVAIPIGGYVSAIYVLNTTDTECPTLNYIRLLKNDTYLTPENVSPEGLIALISNENKFFNSLACSIIATFDFKIRGFLLEDWYTGVGNFVHVTENDRFIIEYSPADTTFPKMTANTVRILQEKLIKPIKPST